MMPPMKKLLCHLIFEAPPEAKGAVALQVQINGQQFAGSVKMAADIDEDLFEMVVVDPQQKLAVSVYFTADNVGAVFVPKKDTSPVVEVRRSGIIIPGAH